jgi:hypothetical protein
VAGSRRRGVEARVVRCQFTAVSCEEAHWLGSTSGRTDGRERTVHSASDLAGLLVAPADGGEVCLVVHEPGVEIRLSVWVGRPDVDLATARWVFLRGTSVQNFWATPGEY